MLETNLHFELRREPSQALELLRRMRLHTAFKRARVREPTNKQQTRLHAACGTACQTNHITHSIARAACGPPFLRGRTRSLVQGAPQTIYDSSTPERQGSKTVLGALRSEAAIGSQGQRSSELVDRLQLIETDDARCRLANCWC